MMPLADPVRPVYATGHVLSNDGTTLGYRYLGKGPGIVILHGGMQASQHFMKLATALSDDFSVYVPDRRGRGLSGPHGSNYSMAKECQDVRALLDKTGARLVFGLSSGALISMQVALTEPAVRKVALYEPPLPISGSSPSSKEWLPRFDREIAEGKLVAALVTGLRGIKISPLLSALPRFVSVPLLTLGLRSEGKVDGHDVTVKTLVPTLRFDVQLVAEMEETMPTFRDMTAEVLLLGGTKSPAYLQQILDTLSATIPHSKRIQFSGLDHSGPDDSGKPDLVAKELRHFFGESRRE
jgi:pimeloyl-ACP methyl ester carboxylesterase